MSLLKRIYLYLISSHRWTLMYRVRGLGEYSSIDQNELLSRADPIVIENKGKAYVFFEEFKIEKNRKGYLCVGELNTETGSLYNVKTVLKKDNHLSYPLVFQYRGEWYLIPESRLENSIKLYKFTVFPHQIEFVRNLIEEIDAVDTSIIERHGNVFLFTSRSLGGLSHNSDLSIFYSDDLLCGEFIEHPSNPITSSFGFGRMAGPIYTSGDCLIRPAQDCRLTYGRSVRHFEILKLSALEYEEKLIKTFMPPVGCMATHTYSQSEKYELIDVKQNAKSYRVVAVNFLSLCVSILNKIHKSIMK